MAGAYVTFIGIVVLIAAYVIYSTLSPNQIGSIMSQSSSEPSSHVVIVGGGLAGLSATIEAVRHGSKVTIVEKEKNIGGNSAKATSGMNAVGTQYQKALNIEDSVDLFIKDTLSSGEGLADAELVTTLAHNSNGAVEFLSSFGLNFADVVQLGGHSSKRTHRFPPTKEGKPLPVGFTIMSTLRKYIESQLNESVTVMTNTVFKGLKMENGKVVGVEVTSSDGSAKVVNGAVVLTAGGFANDHTENSLLDRFTPHLSAFPTTNGPWATGDVIKVLEPTGISLIHMDKVQVHPTGFVDPKDPNFHTKFLAPEALRGCGAILLDASGKRFANELGRRDYLSEKILKGCEPFGQEKGNPTVATMLLNQEVIDKFGPHLAGFYKFKGLISDVDSLEGAANKIGVSVDTLKATIKAYNEAAEAGTDEFGKAAYPTVFSESDHFYVAFITPTLHYCMGGIQINPKAQVVGTFSGKEHGVMAGLYAAGEVSGGVHGHNRLGGNSLLECVVYGRIAGQQAAHYK